MTIVAAIQIRRQGLVIAGFGLLVCSEAMSLMPHLKLPNNLSRPVESPVVMQKKS